MIKLGREQPAITMDNSGKIIWAKHSEIQQVTNTAGYNIVCFTICRYYINSCYVLVVHTRHFSSDVQCILYSKSGERESSGRSGCERRRDFTVGGKGPRKL